MIEFFHSLVFLVLVSFKPAPATNVRAFDTPNDAGGSVIVKWNLSKDDSIVTKYEIIRIVGSPNGKRISAGFVLRGNNTYRDVDLKNGQKYYYMVRTWADGEYSDSKITSTPAIPKAQWFHTKRVVALTILVIFTLLLFYYLQLAKKGAPLWIRKIAGLEAIDEAVGRSVEMGRPILYILGLGAISDIPTIAGLAILKRVAKKAAEYEAEILVPNYDPIVMVAAQETVKEGYMEAGRPDLFREKNIIFLTQDQFGYAAGVDGIMVREKPGAIFLQGVFYAESLILAETGHSIGAIQISGTTSVTQLPFFIAATDYTLIGEEMYAASAYLTRDPLALSTLKAEDIMKALFIALMALGTILESLALWTGNSGLHFLKNFFNMF